MLVGTRASANSKKLTFPGRGERTRHPSDAAPCLLTSSFPQPEIQYPALSLWVPSFAEAKPAGISLIREGGEEEKGTQPEPEQGAAAAGGREIGAEEEAKEGSGSGPGAPGLLDVGSHEASGDSGGEPGEQGQDEQPVQAIAHGPQPEDRQQVVQRAMFTQVQVQELECVFHHNAYPNLLMR